ncbi:hypothetical protein [Maribacter sp. ACAM166]|uniref:hypothetical protein n=1 Tax=Maribacter sp. ACAM166 TaxID=2508996 RepID=UPI0010FDF532|nr:hypothetical protein [Maribacter sp. ACAM166]TLP80131.1 hypothetical protein ES765_09115 [Maribacter sp. ACAM166]
MGKEVIFKRMGLPLKEVPSDLRNTVLSDIEDAKLLMHLTRFFSSAFTLTAKQIYKNLKQHKKP